jgi:hypothetical protein
MNVNVLRQRCALAPPSGALGAKISLFSVNRESSPPDGLLTTGCDDGAALDDGGALDGAALDATALDDRSSSLAKRVPLH